MSAITEPLTARTNGTHRNEGERPRRRRREFARAFALGAAVSTLVIGGAWATDSIGAGGHASGSAAQSVSLGSNQASSATGTHSAPDASAPAYQQGPSVVALQHELAQLNYYEGPIDGVLGPATRAAITDFQRANGLSADGVAGAGTLTKIHQQLITGDSQMWPSAPPVKPAHPMAPNPKPAQPTPSNAGQHPGAAAATGGANVAGNESASTPSPASGATTPSSGATTPTS
jgi:peptidoglycan hydrolase-like protein with peptidoglycan-binding domain